MSDKVIDLNKFRTEKEQDSNRAPLYLSVLDGKIKGSPHLRRSDANDFTDRMRSIRSSLEKINRLMRELKKNSREKDRI